MTNSSTGGYLISQRDDYLAPPLEGQALVDFLQIQFQGITALPGNMIRPRWQPEPPNLPPVSASWMAFGITRRQGQTNAYTYHETPKLDEGRTFDHVVPDQFLDEGLKLDAGLSFDQDTITNPSLDEGLSLDTGLLMDAPVQNIGPVSRLDQPSFDIVMRQEDFTVLCSCYGPEADIYASLLREGFSVAQNREQLQLNQIGFVEAGEILPVPALVNERWYYRVDVPLMFRRQIRRIYPVLDIASANGTLNTDISPITRQLIITANSKE